MSQWSDRIKLERFGVGITRGSAHARSVQRDGWSQRGLIMKRICLVLAVLVGLFGCAPKVEEEVIKKDEEKPIVQTVVNDGTNFTITATDNVGVERYMMTSTDIKPDRGDEGWQPNNVFSILRSGRFYFWAKDKGGNISDAGTQSFKLIVNAKPYEMKTTLFTLGLAAAHDPETDLWGYIGVDGEFDIQPKYDDAGSFQENGLAVVQLNERYMVIDTTNKIVAGPSANTLIITDNGLIYEDGTPNIYDASGALVYVLPKNIDGYSDNQWYKSDCTYYDKSGKVMLDHSGSWTCHNFVNGMALVVESGSFDEYSDTGYVGHYMDTTGVKVIENFETSSYSNTIFDNISSTPVYGDGGTWESFYFAANGTAVRKGSNGLLGYVNTSGEWTISPKFVKAGSFNALGMAVVAIENSKGNLVYGLINSSGNYILSPRYDLIWKYYADVTVYRDSNGNLGYVNAKGAILIKPNAVWANASAFYEDGYARVKNQDGLYGIIDKKGRLIIDYAFYGIN